MTRCNKWVGSSGYQAYLCNECSFGSKKDNCIVCNKWFGTNKYDA